MQKKSFLQLLKSRRNLVVFITCLILVILAMQSFSYFGKYADSHPAVPQKDFLHETLPIVDLNWLFTEGFFFLIGCLGIYILFVEPKKAAHFAITMAIFLLARHLLFSMTILGTPDGIIHPYSYFPFDPSKLISQFYFQQDLFPSGHTALPFLGFLLFKKRGIRLFFLAGSILMAFTVVIMRAHYSIDVFGAYFVMFAIAYFTNKYLWKYTELK